MSARPIPWQKVFKPKRPKWPDPEISVGRFYRTMRNSSCWEATGLARDAFDRIGEEIKLYLEKYSEPVSEEVTWTMYMIGKTKETSEPTIMFCGRDEKCRKQVKKTVKQSCILDSYPGVRLGDGPLAPDFDQLVPLAGFSYLSLAIRKLWIPNSDEWELGRDLYSNQTAFAEVSGCLSGKRLFIPLHDSVGDLISVRIATGGGIVYTTNADRHFYLTAGHVFDAGEELPSQDHSAEVDDFQYDFSGAEDSDEDGFVDTTSCGSTTPDIDDSITSDDTSASSSIRVSTSVPVRGSQGTWRPPEEQPPTSIMNSTGLEEVLIGTVAVGRQVKPLLHLPKAELDYSLIEIFTSFHDFDTPLFDHSSASPCSLSGELLARPHNKWVTSLTSLGGWMRGTMSGTPTYQNVANSRKIQQLWTVKFEDTLSDGDCGSWVYDEESGALAGHIIAGSPKSGVAYIVPACHVFADAKTTLGLDLEIKPSPSSMRPEAKTQSIFPTEIPSKDINQPSSNQSQPQDIITTSAKSTYSSYKASMSLGPLVKGSAILSTPKTEAPNGPVEVDLHSHQYETLSHGADHTDHAPQEREIIFRPSSVYTANASQPHSKEPQKHPITMSSRTKKNVGFVERKPSKSYHHRSSRNSGVGSSSASDHASLGTAPNSSFTYQQVYDQRQILSGIEHKDTLKSKYRLALTLYKQQGRFDEAEQLFRQVVQQREKMLGVKHEDTLYSKHWLAYTLYQQQNYGKAEPLLRQSLQQQEKMLGVEHKDTLYSKYWLARTLFDQQKYDKAAQLFQQSVQQQKKVLGTQHKDTLNSIYWLAKTLHEQQMYGEAEQLFRHVVQEEEKVLGIEHKDTLDSKFWLAITLYEQQGKSDEAEQLFQQVVQQQEKVLGIEHEDTLDSKFWLAMTLYEQQGKSDEAEQLLRQVVQQQEKVLGIEHKDTLDNKFWLAITLFDQQKYDKAEQLLRQVVQQQEKVLGIKHKDMVFSKILAGKKALRAAGEV
jgi:TolA-binding protein